MGNWALGIVCVVLLILALTTSCASGDATNVDCDRVDNLWAGRVEYFENGPPQTLPPTKAHLETYVVLNLYADDLSRNPRSEAVFTVKDVQVCRAAG